MKDKKNDDNLPKVFVEIVSELNEIYMKSKVQQEFQNILPNPVELKITIPNNHKDIVFSSFTAKIGNSKNIKSKVIKDEKASEKYNDSISEGNSAIYAKKSSNGEKYIIYFGNIPPKEKVIFITEFLQDTKYKEKFECELFRNLPIFEGLVYYQNISLKGKLEIKTQNKIIGVEKQIETENLVITEEKYQNEEKNNYLILYQIDKLTEFKTIYEEYIKASKILFTIQYNQPLIYSQRLSKDSNENIYSILYPTNVVINEDIELNPGLFIFLLDQSNSMKGDRIKMVREALKIFLQSIPKDSYYQIIGFGTKYKKYDINTVVYNKINISKSLQEIDELKANMGGTNIYSPLQEIYSNSIENPKTKQLPKAIFLLTDGFVNDKEKTLQLIEKNSNRYSIYSIGVGNNFDKDFIKRAGILGKGIYNYCPELNNLTAIISKNIKNFVGLSDNNMIDIKDFNLTSSLDEKYNLQKDETPKRFNENTKIIINYLTNDNIQHDKINLYIDYNIGNKHKKEKYSIIPKKLEDGNELFKLAFRKYISDKENLLKNLIEYRKEKKELNEEIGENEINDYTNNDEELNELFAEVLKEEAQAQNNKIKEENMEIKRENELIRKENELIEKENAPIVKEILDICLKYQILSKCTSLFAQVDLTDKITEKMQYYPNDVIKETDKLVNIVKDDNITIEKKIQSYNRFYQEYIDEIDTLPENKINELIKIEELYEYYEYRKREIKIKEARIMYKNDLRFDESNDFIEKYNDINSDLKSADFLINKIKGEKAKNEMQFKQLNNKMKLKKIVNLKKNIKNKGIDKNKVIEIIQTQDFLEGFWELNNKTNIIKTKYQKEFDLILGLKKNNTKINEKIAMTILTIYYICENYPELIEEIIMIIQKGKKFIKTASNESYENILKIVGLK